MIHKEPKYTVIERITHWIHMAVLLLLLFSGWYIYSPATAPFFNSMASARLVHFVCMWIFFFTGLFHAYYYFVTGRFATDSLHLSDLKDLGYEVKNRYLLLQKQDGRFAERFGPLEKLAYEVTFVLSALTVITGFLIYYGTHPTSIGWFNVLVFKLADIGGGLQSMKALHLIFAWFFAVYIAVHVYFFLTEDAQAFFEMVTGRKRIREEA